MSTEVLGGRPGSVISLNDLETLASKVQNPQVDSRLRRLELAIADISTKLQRPSTHDLLIGRSRVQSGLAKQIYDFQSTITKALHDAIPFEPDRIVKDIEYKLNVANYELHDSSAEPFKGQTVRDSIIETVEDILSRVTPIRWKVDSHTRLSALSVLIGIIKSVTSMPQGGDWAECFQSGLLSEILTTALMKIGIRLSDSEIERVQEQKEVFTTLESATNFAIERSGERTFERLEEFQALFIDGATVLDFGHCLSEVDEALAKEPLTDAANLTPRDTIPRKVIERIITKEISWKLNRRSCLETLLNALRVLTSIGLKFVEARRGPHAQAFADGVLEKTLTDAMNKSCSLAPDNPDEDIPIALLIDEELRGDILDLSITKKGMLPGLYHVLRKLELDCGQCDFESDT
jgi:hypothetical protein